MKTMVKKIVAFMLSAMMLTVIPVINASAEEVGHTDWCVEENGVLTWTFAGKMSEKTQVAARNTYNCGGNLLILGSSDVQLESAGLKLGDKATANSYEKCVKFTPNQNGILTVEAAVANTTLYVDTNVRDDLQKAYGGTEPAQITLQAGVDYYIYNNSSNAVTITKITFTPDTTGSTVWDLTNLNTRLTSPEYDSFVNGKSYTYKELELISTNDNNTIDKNGIGFGKTNGNIQYTPSCSGILKIKFKNAVEMWCGTDTAKNTSTGTKIATDEGSITVSKGTKYYIYNGASAINYVMQITFTPDTFTVTFNSDGGSEVPSQQITGRQTASEPKSPTKAGHTFAGWKLNDENYDFSAPVTEGITLVAQWTEGTAGKVGYEGAFTAEGADKPTVSAEGSNYATAYTAEFSVTDADKAVYTNPEIEWSFDFGNDAPEVGNTKRTKSVSTGSLENDFKYGLVINGVYLLEKDATVSATLKNGLSEQAGQ